MKFDILSHIWLFQVVLVPECEKDSPPIQGFSTIIQALVASSKCSDMLCSEKEVQALTQQWLEYVAVCVNHADLPVNAKRVFNVISWYMSILKVDKRWNIDVLWL